MAYDISLAGAEQKLAPHDQRAHLRRHREPRDPDDVLRARQPS